MEALTDDEDDFKFTSFEFCIPKNKDKLIVTKNQ